MACKTGSATNIIYGLALGYKSAIIPVFVLAAIIFTSFQLCGTYGGNSRCWGRGAPAAPACTHALPRRMML